MVLTLVYPTAANNNYKKYYICYRLQLKLQNVHNNWGNKYKTGQITLAEWKQFLSEWYNPRINLVISEILKLRQLAKNKNWNINLNEIFIDV